MAAGGMSARSMKNFGILGYYGVLPNQVGAELAYQGGLARLSAGYLSSGSTGAITGALNLFVPPWSLSPTVGIRANYALSGANPLSLYATGGLSLQTRFGLNIGAGVNYGISNASGLGYFAQVGWFFGKGK